MRLRAQTAKIEGGFVLFPTAAPWLDIYLLELTTFPNCKNDDQVDSTMNALAWSTQDANSFANAWINYYAKLARKALGQEEPAAPDRTQAETDELSRSVNAAYERIVLRKREPDRLCAWCGEELGKSYVNDGGDLYHQGPDRDCYGLLMKHGKKSCA